MLGKTTDFLRDMLLQQRYLENVAQKQGIALDPADLPREDDFGGPKWKATNMEQYEASKVKKEVGDFEQPNNPDDEEND